MEKSIFSLAWPKKFSFHNFIIQYIFVNESHVSTFSESAMCFCFLALSIIFCIRAVFCQMVFEYCSVKVKQ